MFGKYVSRKLIGNKLFYFGLAKSLSPFNEIYLRYPLSVNDILQLNISTSVSNRTTKQKNRSFEFSDEQKVKILQVLNNESQDYFTRLNIPPAQIKKLAVWKTKRGPFNSVVDVLDIEGIDIKNLIKICRSIIRDKPVSINRNLTDVKNRTLTSPVLTDDIIQALQILKDIPTADLYIFESPPGTGLQSQIAKTNYLQQIELLSMLFTLLNTSKKHNKKVGDNLNDVENIVYYVRNKITASTSQHGCLKGRSVQTAIYQFLKRIVDAFEDGDLACGLFLDLSKAYDCLDPEILFENPERYGIRAIALDWVRSYFGDRTQLVKINIDGIIIRSDQLQLKLGIP
ncbi:uncharacterized protein LOC123672393 isoform X3 [Harmonia axyridis]|uniref:uncharacterized protein LOC123672393 isoform X3 n=1 Tax=Harmonia axyridis TaxID=115357 RepID=UPI001E279CCF|nr:uncharacterized protein LOC123672393 isoform X3 [Harmonia axyridis]